MRKDSFYTYFWMFFIGSIFGFIFESILSYFQVGHVINKQELVFGPFMPVYGIGAIILFYISKHIKSVTMTFILSFFIHYYKKKYLVLSLGIILVLF